jgi:hypothetical protein
MQAAELLKYIKNPKLLDKESVGALQKLVKDFPYFQSAHILLSMASKKWDASIYQQSLKKTAIVASNRAHLFKLIHQLENETIETEAPVAKEEVVKSTSRTELSAHELDILKAAEVSTEEETKPLEEKKTIELAKPVLNAEEVLEREIEKGVVNSFVEKEILKTPEFNKPVEKEEKPENFGDWLSFLKKNNGQTSEEIAEQVEHEIAKQESHKKELDTIKEKVEPVKVEAESRKLKNKAIIDKIIESSPGIIRQKEEQRFYAPDIKAKESLLENEHLVTETLAKIYALQGSVSKAIRAYEILSIKSPQKRAYYDGLIQKLKSNG